MGESKIKKIFKDPQNVIAIGVTFISVCALIVSILQTRIMSEQRALMHEQAKVSVWPRLSLGISKGHRLEDGQIKNYAIVISNNGVGPAIISGVRISYDGQTVSNWWDLFDQFELTDSVNTFINKSGISNSIFKSGEVDEVLDLSDNLPLAQSFYEKSDKLKIEILYKSIYGDQWQVVFSANEEKTISVPTEFEFVEEEQFKN